MTKYDLDVNGLPVLPPGQYWNLVRKNLREFYKKVDGKGDKISLSTPVLELRDSQSFERGWFGKKIDVILEELPMTAQTSYDGIRYVTHLRPQKVTPKLILAYAENIMGIREEKDRVAEAQRQEDALFGDYRLKAIEIQPALEAPKPKEEKPTKRSKADVNINTSRTRAKNEERVFRELITELFDQGHSVGYIADQVRDRLTSSANSSVTEIMAAEWISEICLGTDPYFIIENNNNSAGYYNSDGYYEERTGQRHQ